MALTASFPVTILLDCATDKLRKNGEIKTELMVTKTINIVINTEIRTQPHRLVMLLESSTPEGWKAELILVLLI